MHRLFSMFSYLWVSTDWLSTIYCHVSSSVYTGNINLMPLVQGQRSGAPRKRIKQLKCVVNISRIIAKENHQDLRNIWASSSKVKSKIKVSIVEIKRKIIPLVGSLLFTIQNYTYNKIFINRKRFLYIIMLNLTIVIISYFTNLYKRSSQTIRLGREEPDFIVELPSNVLF